MDAARAFISIDFFYQVYSYNLLSILHRMEMGRQMLKKKKNQLINLTGSLVVKKKRNDVSS